MKTAKIVYVARMFQRNVTYSLCRYRHIPILVSCRRRVRDKVAAHPFDRVAHVSRDLRRVELQLVDRNSDGLAGLAGVINPVTVRMANKPAYSPAPTPAPISAIGRLAQRAVRDPEISSDQSREGRSVPIRLTQTPTRASVGHHGGHGHPPARRSGFPPVAPGVSAAFPDDAACAAYLGTRPLA